MCVLLLGIFSATLLHFTHKMYLPSSRLPMKKYREKKSDCENVHKLILRFSQVPIVNQKLKENVWILHISHSSKYYRFFSFLAHFTVLCSVIGNDSAISKICEWNFGGGNRRSWEIVREKLIKKQNISDKWANAYIVVCCRAVVFNNKLYSFLLMNHWYYI